MGTGEPRCKAERRSVWAANYNQDKPTLQPSSQASLPGSSQWLYDSFPQSILLTWGYHLREKPSVLTAPRHSASTPLTQQTPLWVLPKNSASLPAAWTSVGPFQKRCPQISWSWHCVQLAHSSPQSREEASLQEVVSLSLASLPPKMWAVILWSLGRMYLDFLEHSRLPGFLNFMRSETLCFDLCPKP